MGADDLGWRDARHVRGVADAAERLQYAGASRVYEHGKRAECRTKTMIGAVLGAVGTVASVQSPGVAFCLVPLGLALLSDANTAAHDAERAHERVHAYARNAVFGAARAGDCTRDHGNAVREFELAIESACGPSMRDLCADFLHAAMAAAAKDGFDGRKSAYNIYQCALLALPK